MPRIHTFETPEPGEIEILELTGTEVQRIAEQASKDHPLDIVRGTVIEASLKRLQCIRGYRRFEAPSGKAPAGALSLPESKPKVVVDLHVANGDRPHDILAAMSARMLAFTDAAVDHVHEVRPEELKPFLSTHRTKEV